MQHRNPSGAGVYLPRRFEAPTNGRRSQVVILKQRKPMADEHIRCVCLHGVIYVAEAAKSVIRRAI
jgi:hypothetical protein